MTPALGRGTPKAYTAPITRTTNPSSGRLSQVPTGGFPLTRAIAVAYSANWGAQVATNRRHLESGYQKGGHVFRLW